MIPGIQRLLFALGDGGCYFLSIIWLSEHLKGRKWDLIAEFKDMLDLGNVREDGFIIDASAVFSLLMNERWECVKAGPKHPLPLDYRLKEGEREVLRYEYRDVKGVLHAHFVAGDGSGGVAFDPMGVSESVRLGTVVSRRIFRKAI